MVMRALPTDNFACDRALKRTLVAGLAEDHQPILKEIFRQADALAFIRGDRTQAIQDLIAFTKTQPCLPWTGEERSRHVIVRVYKKGDTVISVARAVWACVHVVPEQGSINLEPHEELHHTCAKNGAKSTGHGACLNPAHLVRGDRKTGTELRKARAKLNRILGRTDDSATFIKETA